MQTQRIGVYCEKSMKGNRSTHGRLESPLEAHLLTDISLRERRADQIKNGVQEVGLEQQGLRREVLQYIPQVPGCPLVLQLHLHLSEQNTEIMKQLQINIANTGEIKPST